MCVYRCGSGLSGQALSEEGHYWVGVDISQPMLSMFFSYHYYAQSCVNTPYVFNYGISV